MQASFWKNDRFIISSTRWFKYFKTTVGVVGFGVTLVIEELLAVSTNHKSKDKIHLRLMFELNFWKEFISLRHTLFKHLVNTKMQSRNRSINILSSYLKFPLLLMTAKFNPRLVSLMESITGIKILRENYL